MAEMGQPDRITFLVFPDDRFAVDGSADHPCGVGIDISQRLPRSEAAAYFALCSAIGWDTCASVRTL